MSKDSQLSKAKFLPPVCKNGRERLVPHSIRSWGTATSLLFFPDEAPLNFLDAAKPDVSFRQIPPLACLVAKPWPSPLQGKKQSTTSHLFLRWLGLGRPKKGDFLRRTLAQAFNTVWSKLYDNHRAGDPPAMLVAVTVSVDHERQHGTSQEVTAIQTMWHAARTMLAELGTTKSPFWNSSGQPDCILVLSGCITEAEPLRLVHFTVGSCIRRHMMT